MKKNPIKDRVLLIDFLNFAYRGVVRFGKQSPDEIDYTVVYNFFRNLRALIEQFKPNKCFLALEGIPHFRYKLYSEYKANRIVKIGSKKEETRADFNRQRDIILSLIQHLPIWTVKAEEYEADDVLFTLAGDLKDEEITIVSSDTDLIQIIQKYNSVKLYNATTKEFRVSPNYNYLVQKSLAGDSSDNIPSLISKEKAENVALNPDLLKSFLDIEENRASFSLNRDLIELKTIDNNELIINEYNIDFASLKNEFEKMKLPSLIKDPYWNRFIETFENLK